MNIITPSALKICVTKSHFLHWERFKNQLSYQSKVKCPSDWPYNISQNDNRTATCFLFSALLLWTVVHHPRVSSCMSTLSMRLWYWGCFRWSMYWLFCSWVVNIFYSVAKSIQIPCWWELCHNVPRDELDAGHYSALTYPGASHCWHFEIS